MALKMRKDIKKSSYYVWFLGAQEARGLRGSEYIVPVVKSLVHRERSVEPFKVTLQVSHKGLKIIQNVPQNPQAPKAKKPEVVKHLIPHHAVTCVLQDVDVVACILLLYNPVTKCPVHVHAYRCDSVETAEILKGQLQTLIERPENQKKLAEIETRLQAKGLLLPPARAPAARRLNSGGGSDGRSTSTRESESSGGSSSERLSGGNQERITNLYDSLAAELREKLGSTKRAPDAPILLPPRDYDTVHRQKGNLTAIELRRCMNANIVGVNAKKEKSKAAVISSGGSSGIGSDHAPSPDQADPEQRFLDNQSSSDEEWTEQPSEDSLFLLAAGAGLSLPRARRLLSNDAPSTPSTPSSDAARRRQRTPSPSRGFPSPRDRFKDAKEKFLLLERERVEEQERMIQKKRASAPEAPISPVQSSGQRWSRSRDSEEEDDVFEHGYPRWSEDRRRQVPDKEAKSSPPRTRDNTREEDVVARRVDRRMEPKFEARRGSYDARRDKYSPERKPVSRRDEDAPERRPRRYSPEKVVRSEYSPPSRREFSPEKSSRREYSPERMPKKEYIPEKGARQEYSPEKGSRRAYSPERVSKKEYSSEKNLRREYSPERMPKKEHIPEKGPRQEYIPEKNSRRGYSPERVSKKEYIPDKSPRRDYVQEKPSRGQYSPENKSRRDYSPPRRPDAPYRDEPVRYRRPLPAPRRPDVDPPWHDAQDKRRSMFEAAEDERRRNSNELAKEFKRRSYHDAQLRYQELPEEDRFPGLDRETARHPPPGGKKESRYRHSYAEPIVAALPLHMQVHRTNSSVSSGRVGIAAVHPY